MTATGIATVAGVGTAGSVLADDADPDPARVRVAHKSPDAPDVDVFLGGEKVLAGVPFGAVSGYLSVSPGRYRVRITAAGDPSTVAFDGEVHLTPGHDFTVAAVGELTSSDTEFRPLIFRDFNRDFLPGRAVVRAVHASPDAPAVDVTVGNGRFTLFRNLSFGDVSQYRVLPAIEYPVELRPAGGGDPVASTDVAFGAGRTVTVFAQGYLSPGDEPTDEGLALSAADSGPRSESDDGDGEEDEDSDEGDDDPTAGVRVVHASPDAPDVDVFLGGEKVLSGVSFGTATGYLSVPPGSYRVRITAAGDPSTVAFDGEVTVEGGTDYTVAAIGELTSSDTTFQPLVLTDRAQSQSGRGQVRVVHASPDAPAVDVTVEDATSTLVDGLAFGDSTGYAAVPPGRYGLEVRPDSQGNDNPFDAEFEATVSSGETYTAFATGYFTADDEPASASFDLLLTTDGRAGD